MQPVAYGKKGFLLDSKAKQFKNLGFNLPKDAEL